MFVSVRRTICQKKHGSPTLEIEFLPDNFSTTLQITIGSPAEQTLEYGLMTFQVGVFQTA